MTVPKFYDDIEAIRNRIAWRGELEAPVLFYGSSSVRLWERMCEDLGSLQLVNAGIGGGTFQSGIYHLDSILDAVVPEQMVVYFGSNDIGAFGLTAEDTLRDQKSFHAAVRARLPDMPIIYLTPAPGPARWIWLDEFKRFNRLLVDAIKSDPNARCVDVMTCLMSRNDLPVGQYFQPDGIHLEPPGYMRWSDVLRNELSLK
jgi:lysophospholipase L1-like esterase